MSTVMSKDGTLIEFDRTGVGPPVILVVGAFNDRATGAALAKLLAQDFTVFKYDRRGKGASGDTLPYAIEREVEDLNALIDEAGGSACVFGYSSGAILALHAAARGTSISKLVLFEPPYEGYDRRHSSRLAEFVAAGRRGDAVEYFQSKIIGLPEQVVAHLRNAPFRPYLEVLAHTTVYDTKIVCEPPLPDELAAISAPVLAIAGGKSNENFKQAVEALSAKLSQGQYLCLEGQNHDLAAPVLAPVIKQFIAP